jgi:tRNA(Arg) A34 adenosine deaminase TadA
MNKLKTNREHDPESIRPYDIENIRAAIDEAFLAFQEDHCMPFGAVLANAEGVILIRARNGCTAFTKRGGGTGDVTRHAEMELIRQLTSTIPTTERTGMTLYTSTEPCVMCAGAIVWSNVGRVVYGCRHQQLEELLSGPGGYDIDLRSLYRSHNRSQMISIVGPLLEKEALQCHDKCNLWPMKLNNYSAKQNSNS